MQKAPLATPQEPRLKSMYLSRLGDHVSPAIKSGGEKLYWRNRVRVQRGNTREVNAEVEDGGFFHVRLTREGRMVIASCPCPAAAQLGVCVHIWASLLQAERLSYLGGSFKDGLPEVLAGGKGRSPEIPSDEGSFAAAFLTLREPPSSTVGAYYRWERDPWPDGRELRYVLTLDRPSLHSSTIGLQIQARDPKRDGTLGKLKPLSIYRKQVEQVPDPGDRDVLIHLAGVPGADHYVSDVLPHDFSLSGPIGRRVLELACATNRCVLSSDVETALQWIGESSPSSPFEFLVQVLKDEKFWILQGMLVRGETRIPVQEVLRAAGGLFVTRNFAGPLDAAKSANWFEMLRANPPLTSTHVNGLELIRQVLDRPDHPRFEWHPDLEFRELTIDPVPELVLREANSMGRRVTSGVFAALLSFHYEDFEFRHGGMARGAFIASRKSYIHRSQAAESRALSVLQTQLRLRNTEVYFGREYIPGFEVPRKRLAEVVSRLTTAGWKVQVEGQVFRQSTGFQATLHSEIDWFDLVGGLEFGTGEIVRLPELLKALRRGETMVQLSDGSLGVVPDEVVQRFSPLLQLGHVENGQLRFRRNQAGLLDALLSQRPEIGFDEAFATARAGLRNFEKVTAAEQPPGFRGTLREYQREGVGWMQFLQKLGVGGCLADDMGVGKTPQMLALLETRRKYRPDIPPSLAVVPRSLVYNWMQEAAKFTPGLRVLDHTGPDRNANWDRMQDFDLVLSTYGTLRRDAADFRSFEFDYVILDEAQAIKNASSESAKAARLLQGKHRMVLTGTPIENHLGELWSLLEFLNPGMLGASVLQGSGGGSLRNPDEELRTILAKALRPYILRRTKEQVARELPSKIEQTVYCELEGEQKKLYQELRDHYRQTLLGKIDDKGIGRAKLQILEALLRLRQAACHPGLIDKSRLGNESAKLDTLLDQLESVVSEGHKALVFSQFTSLLAIVCERLTEAGITYEYLDGKTRNRQARVDRFQTDPKCPVFLISLKAGGVGLNLTAADYVFLLDPWWNPAVEAQAVDRAHRIGQTRQVFTYRLIAKDTVEEKVLLLQEHKKDLANAIIHADEGMVKSLKREDLEILFG